MSDEFDYSPLYNDQQPQAQQPAGTPGAADTAAQPAAEAPAGASAYPNVGSSGINTANTARTDYADSARAAAQPGAAQPGAAQPGAAQPGAPAQGGYYSTYGGSGYGYSYASAPQQPPVKKRKKGRAGKVLLRIAAVVALVALSLPPVAGGDSPMLQQQNFSLAALAKRDAKEDPFTPGAAGNVQKIIHREMTAR